MPEKEYLRSGISDTTASDVDRYVSSIDVYARSALEPGGDPYAAARLQRQSLNRSGELKTGVVMYSLPTLGWYKVRLEDRGGVRACCKAASDGSPMVVGVNDVSQLPPGARVLVWLPPTGTWGVITSCLPWQDVDGNVCYSDEIVQGSGVGSLRDPHHANYINSLDDEGGVVNFRNHRPNDSLAGDWGRTTVTGVGLHLDPDMFYARVSEVCGVFGFAADHFLRVAGFGLEVVTAGHHQKVLYDDGELYFYEGRALFPWEAVRGRSSPQEAPEELEEKHYEGNKSRFEPEMTDEPYFRYEEFGGYLGQGQIRQLRGAEDGANANAWNTLFREHVGLNGAWSVQSTNSLLLAKRGSITSVVRKAQPDSFSQYADHAGDGEYAFSGAPGEAGGAPHKIREIQLEDRQNTNAVLLRLFDFVALETDWLSIGAFKYHKKDWEVKNEQEDFSRPDYSSLANSFGIDGASTPDQGAREAAILGAEDGQEWKTVIQRFLSLIRFNEDGSLVILGGRGESIVLGRGQIELTAPDGILVTPGKSLIVLAGDDISLRAKNSVDVSAERDTRIYAGKNLAMAGGDDKEGGVLIEARGVGDVQDYPAEGGEKIKSAGITLKAAKSFITANGKEIYLRTGSAAGGVEQGNIVLDASRGDADIVQIAGRHTRFAKGTGYFDAFGTSKVTGLNSYTTSGSRFYGGIYTDLNVEAGAAVRAKSGVISVNGGFSSRRGGTVGILLRPDLEENRLDTLESLMTEYKHGAGAVYDSDLRPKYESQGLGNDELQKSVSFGFRTEKEYGTENNFELLESPWRQIARLSGAAGLTSWDGLVVKYQGKKDTLAWPGYKSWTEKAAASRAFGLNLFSMTAGKPDASQEEYEKAEPAGISKVSLKSFYRIVTTE